MPSHRKPALYRDEIEQALRAHNKLPVRSEKHQHFHDLFVDRKQLVMLESADWQVLYGRRGTGKSFLFGMLHEQAVADTDRLRVLSVLVSAQDCKVSPTGRVVEGRRRALGYFQTFIELLADELSRSIEPLLGKPNFLARLNGSRNRRLDQIEDLLIELLELSQSGRPVVAFGDFSATDEDRVARFHGSSANAGLRGHVTPGGPGARFEAGAGAHASREQASEVASRLETPAVPRYALLRQAVVKLVDLLELSHLNILIDEWSTLDPTAATAIQPEFAELLKRTFAGTTKVSVKIATNRYQTRFSNRGAGTEYRGLELGADIFEATNLDRAMLSQGDPVTFYRDLLFKRLLYVNPDLDGFRRRGTDEPDPEFLNSMFHDARAFEELVRGAEGNPRHFLHIFKSLAHRFDYSLDRRWTALDVQDRIRETSVSGEEDVEYQSEAGQLLSPCIRDVVAATGSRVFLVPREKAACIGDAVDELLEKRLIHEYPRRELAPVLRDQVRGYLLDYGLWLDWTRAFCRVGDDYGDGIPALSAANVVAHTIDASKINQTDIVTCVHCHAAFPRSARSYNLRGLCTECFEPADVEAA